jgi:hypothetical protein
MWRSLWGIVLLIPVLTGCASVTLVQPLPAMEDAAERARFEGEWIMDGEIVYVRFGSKNTGQFAGVDWKEEQFQLDTGELVVSRGMKHDYLSVRVKMKDQWEDHYYFAQYAFTDEGNLLVWLPDPEAFDQAIQEGRLEGAVERTQYTHNVELTDTPEKILAFLNEPGNGDLFDYSAPRTLKRLAIRQCKP